MGKIGKALLLVFVLSRAWLCYIAEAKSVSIHNAFLSLSFSTNNGSFEVIDKKSNMVWKCSGSLYEVEEVSVSGQKILARMRGKHEFNVEFWLPKGKTDLYLTLSGGKGISDEEPSSRMEKASHGSDQELQYLGRRRAERMPRRRKTRRARNWRFPYEKVDTEKVFPPLPLLSYPYPLVPKSFEKWDGTYLLLNLHEGLMLPMSDPILEKLSRRLHNWYQPDAAYKQMNWIGLTDLKAGYFLAALTPWDMGFRIARLGRGAAYGPQALVYATKGRFGYPRRILYHFVSDGGVTSLALEYRKMIVQKDKSIRRFKASELRKKLKGVADIWLWGKTRTADFLRELKNSGIERAIISVDLHSPPQVSNDFIKTGKQLGFLMGRYDNFSVLRLRQGDSLNMALVGRTGRYAAGPRGVVLACSRALISANPERIRPDSVKPYEALFIDTLAAGPLRECYSDEHPTTRKMDRKFKTDLIDRFVNAGIVVGSENVSSWAIAHAHYFEGVMSHEIFKGRRMRARRRFTKRENPQSQAIFLTTEEIPDLQYEKYGLSEKTLIPLFELVYHEYAVSTWHWRDSNQKMPNLWWKKNLFNILYGTIPLFNITQKSWQKYKKYYVQTFQTVCRWHKHIAFKPMTSFEFLTEDRSVQKTKFGKDAGAIVNFGKSSYKLEKLGITVPAKGFYVYDKDWHMVGDTTLLQSLKAHN